MNADTRAGLSDASERTEAASDQATRIAEFGPTLLATARALVPTEAEALDLAQTTLEIGLRRQADLRDPLAARGWLMTIEIREAYRLTRRLRRAASLRAAVTEIALQPEPEVGDLDLRAAISHLPRRIRAAVVLHHFVGLSVEETATALGTSRNTVKTQLHDGLGRLREELRHD